VDQDGNEYCLHHDNVGRALVNVVNKTVLGIQKRKVAGMDLVAAVLDIPEAEDSREVVVVADKAALGIEVRKKVEVGKLEAAQDR